MSNETITDARVKTLIREMDKIVRRDDGEPVWLDPVDAAHIAARLRDEAAVSAAPAAPAPVAGDDPYQQGYRAGLAKRLIAEVAGDAVDFDAIQHILKHALRDGVHGGYTARFIEAQIAALAQDRASQEAAREG